MDLLNHYNYIIQYRPGNRNGAADALSRHHKLAPKNPEEEEPATLFPASKFANMAANTAQLNDQEFIECILTVLEEVVLSDEQIQECIHEEVTQLPTPDNIIINNGLPYHKDRVYSEQKNCPTKGQISLVSQISAQITKLNLWEIFITKVDILSFVIPNYRSLVHVTVLISILQYGTLDGTVFLLALGSALFGLYHCLHPSGHALNQVSTNLLGTLSGPTFTCSTAYVHQQE